MSQLRRDMPIAMHEAIRAQTILAQSHRFLRGIVADVAHENAGSDQRPIRLRLAQLS